MFNFQQQQQQKCLKDKKKIVYRDKASIRSRLKYYSDFAVTRKKTTITVINMLRTAVEKVHNMQE